MHHDALQFFPLPLGSDNSTRGLLAINNEYTDEASCTSVAWSRGRQRRWQSPRPRMACP